MRLTLRALLALGSLRPAARGRADDGSRREGRLPEVQHQVRAEQLVLRRQVLFDQMMPAWSALLPPHGTR